MSDVRNKPCMSHYPDFDHHCASKGQGCEYYEDQDEKFKRGRGEDLLASQTKVGYSPIQ